MHRRWLGELVFAHPAQHLADVTIVRRAALYARVPSAERGAAQESFDRLAKDGEPG
jgi:hypothetical protein